MKLKKLLVCASALVIILESFCVCAFSAGAEEEAEAVYVTVQSQWSDFTSTDKALDGKQDTYATGSSGATLTLTAEQNIGFIYLEFNHAPGEWTLSSGEKKSECGQNGFIHEYADVSGVFGETKTLTLTFPAGAELAEFYVYGEGKLPASVQVWEPVCDQADILLLSAHSDDDQLYFAGLIPYYTQVRKVKVQVIFFTEHFNENVRWHERLDSLWVAGLRNYPVVSDFPDAYSTTLAQAYSKFASAGFTEENITDWLAEQIRTFRPLVAVTHNFDGEAGGVYANGTGHGQHMAAADALTKAAVKAADSSAVYGSLEAYDLPKLYIHGYAENPIVLSCIDETFEVLGGITPFNVSQNAFLKHESQYTGWTAIKQWMWGTNYPVSKPQTITVTKAEQIKNNSPLYYGLYRTAAGVAADSEKNDLLENLTPYGERIPETTEEITTTAPETSAELTAETETEATSTEQTGETVTSVTESETAVQTAEPTVATQTLTELEYPGTARKPMLVLISVVCTLALVIVLYIGIQIIRKCDNP